LPEPFRRCVHCLKVESGSDGICPSCRYDGCPRNPPPVLREGTPVGGRYILGRKEGQGGFSICYRAWDGVKDDIVAIKELFPAGVAERLVDGKVWIGPEHRQDFDTAIRSLRHEADVLQKLTQVPSIVRVGDVFQDNETAYLSLEYLRGQSYEKYLQDRYTRTGSHLDVRAAVNVALTVLGALGTVHARGLLHLDVKPANIRVLDDARIVLLDFGSARDAFRKRNGPYGDTFTPGFAATEQHHPDGVVTAATDVYALASTLYFSLSLRVPTRADERENGSELQLLSELSPQVPQALALTIEKAMAIDARDRYSSAAELRKALEPFGVPPQKIQWIAAPQALRIVAGLLDAAAVVTALAATTAVSLIRPDQVVVTGILLWWLTQLLPLASGTTPGMLLTDLCVIEGNGAKAGLRALLVRALMLILMLATFQYRANAAGLLLHDRLSRSRVVVRNALRLGKAIDCASPLEV
jgi:uncharacterized RDD family membrane protein YckC